MAKTLQVLKQVRNAIAAINRATDNPEFKALQFNPLIEAAEALR